MGRHCCCCTDDVVLVPTNQHRDLVTGDPWADDPMLDAVEVLWQCFDGDLTGLTQETITHNCTVEAATATTKSGGMSVAPSGYVRFTLSNIQPTDKAFSAIHVIWTGQTFDAFSHTAHIAGGYPRADAGGRKASPFAAVLSDAVLTPGPAVYAGIAIRRNGLLFLYTEQAQLNRLEIGETHDACFDTLHSSRLFVLENGVLRSATVTERRDAGLQVDPIATQVDNEVGFFFGIAPQTAAWSGDLESSYTVSWDFDQISISAEYGLDCEVAFVDKSTLTLSQPSFAGPANLEPLEFRGLSETLTLTTLPAWPGPASEIALKVFYDYGYAYVGQFVINGVTIDAYYLPCQQITLRFDNGVLCPLFLTIEHDGLYTESGGTNDASTGRATAPAFSGATYRDINWLTIGTQLSVPWFGSDCVDAYYEWKTVDGVLGYCRETIDGYDPSTCLTGVLPNQLDWMTYCYSLDPIAIGYRRRVTDIYGAFGYMGPCKAVDDATYGMWVCDVNAPGAEHWVDSQTRCPFTHLQAMGFTLSMEVDEGPPSTPLAFHFYLDITE